MEHQNKIALEGNFTIQELMHVVRDNAVEYFKREALMSNVQNVKSYLQTALAYEERENFAVMFLDNKHALIKFEIIFKGGVDNSQVDIREVIKRALIINSSALIISHNHPSGSPEPSQADIRITEKLKTACDAVGLRLLDHMVVGKGCISFAERGLL